MSARDDLRRMVREALEDRMQTLEQATDAVMALFRSVDEDFESVDVSTYVRQEVRWTRQLLAGTAPESTYTDGGRPVGWSDRR